MKPCIYIIIFAGIISLLTTCKKYDEDGKRSWHKPEKRVVGSWYLKEFLVDGADSVNIWYEKKTNDITDTIKWQLFDTRFNYEYKNNENTVDIYDDKIYIRYNANNLIGNIHTINKWHLENKNNDLYFSSQYEFKRSSTLVASFSIFGDVTDTWEIKKLTNSEMILEADRNDNKHLRLKFQK